MTSQCTVHLSGFNMTSSGLILLTVTCFIVKTNSVENIYSDNGWRPMSNEKVFELQRNFIKTPLDVRIKNVPENPMDNIIQRGNVIRIVQANHLKESIKTHEAMFPLIIENESNGRAFEESQELVGTVREPNINLKEQKNIKMNHVRKAKKIVETDHKLIKDNEIRNSDKINSKEAVVEKRITSKPNTYEVEENLEEEHLLSDQHELTPRNSIGYKYQIPKETKRRNLTSNLFDILANYNIRTGDKMSNYALSLRQNSRNSNKDEFVYMHVPVKIPLRYNSPNHFPIDPLLAVFLSNYGYYLPGLYGYQRSFNNLYGYLASNNIHNNKPFGSYKVFSDKNSSH